MKKVKTLDQVKLSLIKDYKEEGVLLNSEVEKAISHLELTDDQTDELFNWFGENDIVLTDEDDEEFLNIFKELSRQFSGVEIVVEFADEDIGTNCGKITFLNGEIEQSKE